MKKWVMIIAGVVIVVVAILFVVVISNLGPVIKTAVNTYGPEITKTDVHLSDVDVSLLSAQAEIRKFYLGNPAKFKSPEAMTVRSIYIDMNEKSLLENPIIIEKIEVVAPEITYEKMDGTDNFQTILNNIKRTAGAEKRSEKKSGGKGKGKRIIIKNFILRDGKIKLVTSILGGEGIFSPLPDIHLTNIGQKDDGASPAEALKEIFTTLYAKIISPDVTNILNSRLKELDSNIDEAGKDITGQTETLRKDIRKETDALKGKIKGLLGD